MIPDDGAFRRRRKLDWTFSYVSEREAYPEAVSGRPWLSGDRWTDWNEPFRTTYGEYVATQDAKEASVRAVREAVGRPADLLALDAAWRSAIKLHAATFPLAEFAATVGNLRGARFGRDGAWRAAALFGALDELRHTQIPLLVLHDLVAVDPQFDWVHRFYHTDNWVAIAGRHLVDELLLQADPIEFALGTNFVFETGFTNLQFVGLSALARGVGDRMFEKMVTSIQTDEARHAQIGLPVLQTVLRHDPERAQYLLDKWFWRTWRFFAIVTGFGMDYLTPVRHRSQSFREFMDEWILDQYDRTLAETGLRRPWYWEEFLASRDLYHHLVYASAYTYRATVWFDFPLPGPEDRRWLREKYPSTWDRIDPVWERITARWRQADPGNEWFTQGATPVTFCDLCQLVLCAGTPDRNEARVVDHAGRRYVFCSGPCEWIFRKEPERYAGHRDVVKRILAGEAPANVLELVRTTFGLSSAERGRDAARGTYPWLERAAPPAGSAR